ncbi:MAG TPA: diaminopimelate decarboxylase [Gammaproteobacteria bacterium]|nr:diaminopimelate decarboxylase [bacterium BMS3Abin11]GMT40835.1 MAG: diaminopimelate decarboxylase [bacterium]HDH17226.1 diaminopimelate decarboxylase [Gammaproteobacteria bacterium]
MDHFIYQRGQLHAESVPLAEIARSVGTPAYVYSRATLSRHYLAFDQALQGIPHLICYAVKANSNLAVLNVLARLGAGFDIVSGGELERVMRAGGDPGKVIFSGVGKTSAEIRASLRAGIKCFNVESADELERIAGIAGQLGVRAPTSLRVNPDVDPKTHPYISTGLKENKFGIPSDEAYELYTMAHYEYPMLDLVGIDCHIGSQLMDMSPVIESLDRVLDLVERLKHAGVNLRHLDIGGGLGISYQNERPPEPEQYVQALRDRLRQRGETELSLVLEPGRAIAGNAGVLLTRVEYLKNTPGHHFAIVDAAMNDLMRPALYDAWQEVVAVAPRNRDAAKLWDIVGPVCETADTLAKQRKLSLQEGDLLAIRSSGAYGFSMSSNYNSRPRPPEIMVDGEEFHVVRRREVMDDLMAMESLLPGD